MKKLLILITLFPFFIYGQDCNCESNFNWTKKTFEENDAGFQYIIDTKGKSAYEMHNVKFQDKIKNVKDVSECHQVINEWLMFFRKGHIGLQYLGSQTEESNKEEKLVKEEWETYSTDISKFKTYLKKKKKPDFEGIWETGSYQIGIKKEGKNYIGFIIESTNESWKKEEVKLKILNKDNLLSSIFYMGNRSGVESETVELLSINNLQLGEVYLTRVFPELKDESPYDMHIKAINSELPFLEQINKTTLYFRIPSFSGTPEKKAIEKVIDENKELILSTENLIIDIRYGTGGFDDAYEEILPLFYTNPIRIAGMEMLSTPLNNQRMLDFSNNTGMALEFKMEFTEEQKKEYKIHYDKLSQQLGEFVDLDSSDLNIVTLDTVYAFPENVAIIHNHKNGSTDEQFLLAAKQSKKVKLFGTPTMGALDFSNMNTTKSPCGDYVLWYTLSKSNRIPEMAIDGVGIQPDYYIDKEIEEYQWIDYVNSILNK